MFDKTIIITVIGFFFAIPTISLLHCQVPSNSSIAYFKQYLIYSTEMINTLDSLFFLFIFLPLSLFFYFILVKRDRARLFYILALSLIFYCSLSSIPDLILIFALSAATYLAARHAKYSIGLAANLFILGLYKFFDLTFAHAWFAANGFRDSFLIAGLPLGLSYVVFKHLGYLFDVRNGRIKATSDYFVFSTYTLYFPQIIAGPISAFGDTGAQLKKLAQQVSASQVFKGLVRLTLGLAKVILISHVLGDWIAIKTNAIDRTAGLWHAWAVLLAYSMQLYFDFSGYTDIVIGVSHFFGINLPENFNNPYTITNYSEFWKRWHMSLSDWFRVYFFSPLSRFLLKRWGRDKRFLAQYSANLVTMALIGLWHGSTWGLVAWGVYHGVLLNINAWWSQQRRELPKPLARTLFLLTVFLGWAIFLSPDWPTFQHFLTQLFGFGGLGAFRWSRFRPMITLAAALVMALFGMSDVNIERWFPAPRRSHLVFAVMLGILFFVTLSLKATNVEFIYGQF